MLDINALNTEIYTKLNVSAITTLATGGVYHVKAPQGTAYPFITYFAVINVQSDTFTEWGNDTLIQIDIWSDSNSAAESGEIVEDIAGEMDDKPLTTIGDYNDALFIRQNTRLLYESETKIFHQVMEYSVRWSKSM